MPKTVLRPSSFVFRLLFGLAFLAVALLVAASAPASQNGGGGGSPSDTPPAVYPGPVTPAVANTAAANVGVGPSATAAANVGASPSAAGTATAAPPTASPAVTFTAAPPIIKTTGVPRFEAGECTFNLPSGVVEGKDVKCGTLVVYEEHADPSSPTIQLAVAILPAQSAKPLPDPMVFNQGGPGFGSIDTYLPILVNSLFRARRDLVLFDQRGTGHSNPALACPEVIDETIATLDQNLSVAEADAKFNTATLLCRDRLVHQGINLSAYNTQESAADIEDLRVALGYQQLNLYGVSYGSLLVLDTLRFFPQSVRSAVIDGVVPPQGNMNTGVPYSEDRAFTELFKACAADANCNTAYPHLEDTFFSLVAQLNQKPATVRLLDPDTGQIYPAVLNGDGLISAVFQAMYASDLLPAIPEIIHRATRDDYAALEPILALINLDRSWLIGMYWSVYCAEDADFDPAAITYNGVRSELSQDQVANNQSIKSLCQAWKVRDLAPVLNTPVTSSVPTLVLNGRFDPITPPSNGILAAQTLSNSTVITVPTTAHGAFPAGGQCISQIMGNFVENPLVVLDSRCLAAIPAITFVTPSNIVDFSVVRLANDAAARKPGLMLGVLILLLSTLALLSGLILFPISWLIKRGAKPPDELAGMDPSALAGTDPGALAGGGAAMAAGGV
jgi:pimeloyl-ACP methyl ester carboxylesterase